jgi:hypothetical protein
MQRKLPVRFGGGWAETDACERARRRPSTLRHAFARIRRQSPRHPALAGPSLADHHGALHASDPEGRRVGQWRARYALCWHAMTTLGEIFRRYGPAYRARCGRSLSPSQVQTMQAIEACRTEALGGHVYSCPACQITRYSYHSCRNRHCPTCRGYPGLARRAACVALAGSLLPGHLHAALRTACHRPSTPGDDLSPALSHLRCGVAAAGPRPALSGWPDWHFFASCKPGRATCATTRTSTI